MNVAAVCLAMATVTMTSLGLRAMSAGPVDQQAPALDRQIPPAPPSPPPSQTPGATFPVPQPVVLPPRVGVEADTGLSLTLDEAIRLTLEQNNDVAVARLELSVARENVRAAEGLFDPVFAPTLSYERANTPNVSAIGGATEGRIIQRELFGGFQFAGRSPGQGGDYLVDFTASRLDSSNQFSRLNPQYPSALTFTFTQPLLRDRSIDAERRQILLSKRAVDLTDSQLRSVLTEQLTMVEQAYWDLVFATRNLAVQKSALEQALGQVASNERQTVAGTLAPIDVVEAQTQVAQFRQTVASAQQTLTEAENRLKMLMLRDRAAPQWNRALIPADLMDRPAPQVSLDEAMKLALTRRPELSAADATLAQNDIDRRFFRNQALPQVNLSGTYSLRGLAGTGLEQTTNPLNPSDEAFLARLNELAVLAGLVPLNPPESTTTTVPDFFVGAYGSSLRNLFERRFPTALVQVSLSVPLRNRTAKANAARADLQREQIEHQRRQLEQVIKAEVRNALQAVQSSQARLSAAASQQRNAQEQYDSERRRFDSGLSTVFLVLERQTTLVTAQAAELRARADLNQAIASFNRAIGGTFERHGITAP
jgi:HAE1 family hydrophobic/amphiphilic exporter-1